MPRSTDSTTSLSLTASSLSALFPESLSGEEALNALGSQIFTGINDGASLTLTSGSSAAVATAHEHEAEAGERHQ